MPFRRIGAGITLVVMLAACGSAAPAGSTPPGATPAPGASATAPAITTPAAVITPPPATVGPGAGALDTCALITVAEAAAATGVAVARADGSVGACIYYGAGDALVLTLGTEVTPLGLAALNEYIDDPANELVPGIGDKAVIYQAGDVGKGRDIYVRKGTRGFHLTVVDTDIGVAQARTILIQLATMVAGRI